MYPILYVIYIVFKVKEHYNRKAIGINILVDLYMILVLISLVNETDRHMIGSVCYKILDLMLPKL